MTKVNKNTREVLKKIPSIDEILKRFSNSSNSIPIDFLKFNINKELQDIRSEFKKGLNINNPQTYIDNRISNLL